MSTFDLQIMSTDQSTPRCPNCDKPMRFTRSIPALEGLSELQAFECRECGVMMTEAAKTEVFVRHLSATAHVDRRILIGLIRVLTKFVPRLRATPHALAPPAGTLPISFSTSLAALKASRPAGIPQ